MRYNKHQRKILPPIRDWAAIRREILDRDNHCCRICRKGIEASLNVHHIDYDRDNNDIDNLVTLCGVCHRAVHNEHYKPSEYEDWPVPWGDHPGDWTDLED